MKSAWLTVQLQEKIRNIFEPRYNRKLSDKEVMDIAENLTGYMESILQFRWKIEYEKQTPKT